MDLTGILEKFKSWLRVQLVEPMGSPSQAQAVDPQPLLDLKTRHALRQPITAMGLLLSRLSQMPQDIETRDLLLKLEASVSDLQALLDDPQPVALPARVSTRDEGAGAAFSQGPGATQGVAFSLQGCRVLVVEDDAVLSQAFELLLQSWGCETYITEGLAQAQARISAGWLPDVMLSDYRLGGQANGIDTLKALREQLGTPTPACLVSGDLNPALLSQAMACNLSVMYKPLRPAKLRVLLRNLLQSAPPAEV
jgi:CheY-like chemotaxis protein